MLYIHVRHRVGDYAKWREAFDAHAATRKAGGATGEEFVMRNVDDPDEVTAIIGWSDLEKARQFAGSQQLKEAMQEAGVTGPPDVRFLETV